MPDPHRAPTPEPGATHGADPVGSLRYVFVYGTLRAGGSNDIRRLKPAPHFVGNASLAGVLYDLGPYPGLRLGGDRQVRGEVYRIDALVEAALDQLEGVQADDQGEYLRREVDVQVGGGALRCLVYEINSSRTAGTAPMAHGDWIEHLVSRT